MKQLTAFAVILFIGFNTAQGGEKVVEVLPLSSNSIALPDNSSLDLKDFLEGSIIQSLQNSGKFKIIQTQGNSLQTKNYSWTPNLLPAAKIEIIPKEISFIVGFKGDRTLYGFTENMLPLSDNLPTERILPKQFGERYLPKGFAPFDTQSGMDLGEHFKLNFLVAGLNAQYSRYESKMIIDFKVTSNIDSNFLNDSFTISSSAKGYFVDLSAQYIIYEAGVLLGRKDAMNQALQITLEKIKSEIIPKLSQLPHTGTVDAFLGNLILLSTGGNKPSMIGKTFRNIHLSDQRIQVVDIAKTGVIAKNISIENQPIQIGSHWVEEILPHQKNNAFETYKEYSTIQNLLPPELTENRIYKLAIDHFQDVLKTAFLPYRVWRYFKSDRPYSHLPDGSESFVEDLKKHGAHHPVYSNFNNSLREALSRSEWTKQNQFSIPRLSDLPNHRYTSVAVVDTGMDYNHPFLHSRFWKIENLFDFGSADFRPADDNSHGTMIAGAITTIAPQSKILPVKFTNYRGETSAHAILSAVNFALSKNPQILVLPWNIKDVNAHFLHSELSFLLKKANEKNILVITPFKDKYFPKMENHIRATSLYKINEIKNSSSVKADIAVRTENFPTIEPLMGLKHNTQHLTLDDHQDLAAAILAGLASQSLIKKRFKDTQSFLQTYSSLNSKLPNWIEGQKQLKFSPSQ